MSNDNKKTAVDKFLEQVKILLSLASALLISPNVVLIILKSLTNFKIPQSRIFIVKLFIILSNSFFLTAIISTYFIYSSIVGSIASNQFDINRTLTRFFSFLQFIMIILGSVLFILYTYLIIF